MKVRKEKKYLKKKLWEMRKIPKRTIGRCFGIGASVSAIVTEVCLNDELLKVSVMEISTKLRSSVEMAVRV